MHGGTPGLTKADVKASLRRARATFDFPTVDLASLLQEVDTAPELAQLPASAPLSTEWFLTYKKQQRARARISPDNTTLILAGSQIAKSVASYASPMVSQLHEQLKNAGKLRDKDSDWWELTADFSVSSPSMAASLVTGKSEDGRRMWKSASGVPYGKHPES